MDGNGECDLWLLGSRGVYICVFVTDKLLEHSAPHVSLS